MDPNTMIIIIHNLDYNNPIHNPNYNNQATIQIGPKATTFVNRSVNR